MALPLAELAGGLPMAASFAFAGGVASVREVRRRAALNAALHELRRPLQALALVEPEAGEPFESSLRLAASALRRLEGAVNGEASPAICEWISLRPLAEAAVRRWHPRAVRAGASLSLRWDGPSGSVHGDPLELAQALDNLIINGIEHGGETITIEGLAKTSAVRLVVRDSGRLSRRRSSSSFLTRVSGRSRHGHGLRLVRSTAAALGGNFRLRRSERGTEAVLELPAEVSP